MPKLKTTVSERLMSKVDKSSGCWNWTAGKDSYGYGQMRVNGRKRLVHRISYEENTGPIPPRLCVLHRCDNPACINPEHLFLGTHRENMDDMLAKGRQARTSQKGVLHGHAKLTEADVLAIRVASGISQAALALQYGMGRSQISNIRLGKCWKHL